MHPRQHTGPPWWIATVLLVLFTPEVPAATDDLDALLSRPATAGNLALLLPHATDIRANQRWAAALQADEPTLRATGARMLHVVGNRSAVPTLARALRQEPNAAAAREMVAALIALVPGPGAPEGANQAVDSLVFETAQRFPSEPFALMLVRARGAAGVDLLDRLQAAGLDRETWLEALPLLVAERQDALDRAVDLALRTEDAELWEAALTLGRHEPLTISPERVGAAATSSATRIRELTWWHIAAAAVQGTPLPDIDAARRVLNDSDVSPQLALADELLGRALESNKGRHHGAARPRREQTEKILLHPFARAALAGPLHGLLTKAERRAQGLPEADLPPRVRPEKLALPEYTVMRTVAGFPPGFTDSVLAETGCKKRTARSMAALAVSHSRDGGPTKATLNISDLREPCVQAARTILMTGRVPRRPAEPGDVEILVLPMHDTFIRCLALEGTEAPGSPVAFSSGGLDPPKKVTHVPPVYPQAALQARRQGIVIIDSTISRHGCVSGVRVTRGAGLELDLAAVQAVTAWEFTPTLVAGKPVPALLTVTVQFTLR